MAKFRNVANGQQVQNWWDNGFNQIAFARGDKAFLAINNDDRDMTLTLRSGLPSGSYCDIISGNKINGSCTGKTITVNGDGTINVDIKQRDVDPMIAIHAESKL
jgi:alpha-amylase